MEIIVICLLRAQKLLNLKKDSEIVADPLCLENISEDVSSADMKKTGLYGSVFDFSVDYRVTPLDDIVDIHKYLMKKMACNIKCLDLLERYFLQQWHFLVLVD